MNRVNRFILNGKRPEACADLMRWARWMQEAERHVAQTEIGDVWVSTVFLGLDHNWTGKGAPVVFETMAFVDGQSAETLAFSRYSTWEQAEAGHAAAVAICQAVVAASHDKSADLVSSLRSKFKNGA